MIYWANGSFATGEQHVALYNSDEIFSSRDDAPILAPTDRAGASKKERNARKDARHYHSLSGTLKQIFRATYRFSIMRTQDLLSLKWPRRASFFMTVANSIRNFYFHRSFIKMCTSMDSISGRFALFAFQNEPEFSVQGRCKNNNNQIQIARELAMNMPVGITLLIKEHAWIGNRSLEAYEDLLKLPNVRMIPFYEKASEIIPKTVFVASLNGSVLFEAAMASKPAIAFSRSSEFLCLENVTIVENLTELDGVIRKICGRVSSKEGASWKRSAKRYLEVMRYLSFDGTPLFGNPFETIEKEQLDKSFLRLTELLNETQSKRNLG